MANGLDQAQLVSTRSAAEFAEGRAIGLILEWSWRRQACSQALRRDLDRARAASTGKS